MANLNNSYYRICRLGIISLFCGNDEMLELNNIDRKDFDKVMSWISDVYMDSIKYEDIKSGKVEKC